MAGNKCIVLVAIGGHVEPECERGLARLETRGYTVRRVSGYAAIDQGRNQMATDALAEGIDEIMWIDSDVEFDPDAVDRLRAHDLPVVCGIHPKKGVRALSCHLAPNTPQVVFGAGGGSSRSRTPRRGFSTRGASSTRRCARSSTSRRATSHLRVPSFLTSFP